MKALLKIEWIQTKRNMGVFILAIGMPVIFFLLFSSLFMKSIPNIAIKERAIREYLLTMTAFSMSGFGIFTFPILLKEDVTSNWTKWLQHSPITMTQYYTGKLVRMLIYFGCAIVLNLMCGILVKGVQLTVLQLVGASLLLLVGGILYLSVGLLLAQISSLQIISIVGNVVYFAGAIFGGSWMPISMFPEWMQHIAKWVPTYHANQLVVQYVTNGLFSWQAIIFVLGYAILFLIVAIILQKRRGE